VKKPKKLPWVSVKVQRSTHEKLDKLAKHVARYGWDSLNEAARQDLPTLGAILDIAVDRLGSSFVNVEKRRGS